MLGLKLVSFVAMDLPWAVEQPPPMLIDPLKIATIVAYLLVLQTKMVVPGGELRACGAQRPGVVSKGRKRAFALSRLLRPRTALRFCSALDMQKVPFVID